MGFEEFAPFTRRVSDLLDDDDLAQAQGLLLDIYAKNEREDLTAPQLKQLRRLIEDYQHE